MSTPSPQPPLALPQGSAAPVKPALPGVQRIASERLFAGAQELQIEHRGALYRLKQTALGKLILTK